MPRTGILLETDNGEIKESNYGMITAARGTGGSELYGFVIGGDAAACKERRSKIRCLQGGRNRSRRRRSCNATRDADRRTNCCNGEL